MYSKLLWLAVPESWELSPGCGRSIDPVFAPQIHDRRLRWESSDEVVASVDAWGRVTANAEGDAQITAFCVGDTAIAASCHLTVRNTPFPCAPAPRQAYRGPFALESTVAQKQVDRWSWEEASAQLPKPLRNKLKDREALAQRAVTADGAVWQVTAYGIRRDCPGEALERDRTMRFMGDRYLYDTESPVESILPDGENGIWAVTAHGITHIRLVPMTAEEKAELLHANTQQYTCRRGAVTESAWQDGRWVAQETDNDGLWTAMYAAGELFHYAVLRQEGADPQRLEAVRNAAARSTEAVLLLANIPCRTGTKETPIHYQTNCSGSRGYSESALRKGGNPSIPVPQASPADLTTIGEKPPFDPSSWKEPLPGDVLETRTRFLAGFPARNYLLKGLTSECPDSYDYENGIYYLMQPGGQAVSRTGRNREQAFINGEYNINLSVDASAEIPPRLFRLIQHAVNSKTGKPFGREDIVYKGDTSLDEIIGHLFVYQVAYDILGPEDPELKQIIVSTIRNLAQHFSDNNYMLIDASGQPCTWGKASREYFYSHDGSLNAPLAGAVLLCVFKTAAYITGEKKWEDEYRLAALEKPYEYAEIMTQYWERYVLLTREYLDTDMSFVSEELKQSKLFAEILLLSNLNYSDEEMAMLCFYLLFQMERDEALLEKYRRALDAWWRSMRYSENPLWYLVYQLVHPCQEQVDAYGNRLVDTAAWALGRHPLDLRRWCATHPQRDDIESVSIADFGWKGPAFNALSYEKPAAPLPAEAFRHADDPGNAAAILAYLRAIREHLAVAAPDERALHKYNRPSYVLKGHDEEYYQPLMMEGSTTYTLPYWLGRYHHLLKKCEG